MSLADSKGSTKVLLLGVERGSIDGAIDDQITPIFLTRGGGGGADSGLGWPVWPGLA